MLKVIAGTARGRQLKTLPKEDFYNIMEGIAVSAGAEAVSKAVEPQSGRKGSLWMQ